MPDNYTGVFDILQFIQATLFFMLLLAVSVYDVRYREIPDRLQVGITATAFLGCSLWNLCGVFGALPYLVAALLSHHRDGIGGGDIKLAGSTGLVLGLPASFMASFVGLTTFLFYGFFRGGCWTWSGKKMEEPLPLGPFLAAGAVVAYVMKRKGMIL